MDPVAPRTVLAHVRAAAGPHATADLYGSSVYAPAHASDVDVLVSTDAAPASLLAALPGFALLPTTPPRLHGALANIPVDITIVPTTADDDVARRMRAGPRDAAALAEHLHAHDRDAVFQATWPTVRRFVHLRALGHNGLGWFGSFGWAILLAAPLVTDPALAAAAPDTAFPLWLRWLARLAPNTRVDFAGTRTGDAEPLYVAAPSPPPRDVARLTKRAAGWLFAEARAAAAATAAAATDTAALAALTDLADAPPSGTTLVITGDDEHARGRYDGTARGLIRDLEALCAARSWGRFDPGPDDTWQHRITVPTPRRAAAIELAEHWLAINRIDAVVE